MLYLGSIILSLCIGAQLIAVAATAKEERALNLVRRRPQLHCTLQAGRPKAKDCWRAFDGFPKNDPTRYIFGPADKTVDYVTPKFFVSGACAIGIYNSPIKYQRDVSDWFPLRFGLAEMIEKCADTMLVGGYYQGWGYSQNLILAMFIWNEAFDLEKLPSVLEVKDRVQKSCEAAVAATPPDKGNTASVSDCSNTSGRKQCLKGATSSHTLGYCAAGNDDDCCKGYTCVPTTSSYSEILLGYLSSTVSLVGQCLESQLSPIAKARRADDVTPAGFRNKHDPVPDTLAMGARADGPYCVQDGRGQVPVYDCLLAWDKMSEVLDGNSELNMLQFGPPGAHGNNFETIFRIEYGDCSIIIANYPDRAEPDMATSQEIKWAAGRILSSCVITQGNGGVYFNWGAIRSNIAVTMASKAAAPRRAEVNAVSVNGDIPEPASFDGDSHAARLKATEPCMPWQRSSRASKGSGSQRSIAYCTSQSDCCIGYRCAWQKVTQWFILLGKVQPFFDGGVGTCISAVSTELSTVQGREAEVAPSELESQRRIKERRDDNHKIRRTVSRNRLHRRRGKPRKRSYDPFCNEEYGRPDRDDCDRAWHQVPQGPIQRWFFNGNYDALPSFETIRPLEKLPQVWESGTCKIQIKFTVDEDVGSEPDKDPNEEDFDHFVRPPFVYRPFDETTWDEIDNAALDIYSFCVAHPLSGLGGSDMAVSKYKKLEVNMYALDSQYNKDEVATAAAATTAQNPGGAGQQSGTDGGLGKPQNKPPFPSWKSPQTSPYWFMEHCPTGTIYCTKDSDCGEACGPGQSCKILNLLSQVIMTGMQVAKTIAGLGSCHPL